GEDQETLQRRLAGRAVGPHVGDLAHPPDQMRLQRRPAGKAVSGDGVALHVTDAALVLALGAGAVRRTGARLEAPVSGEGLEAGVEPHLARGGVMVVD